MEAADTLALESRVQTHPMGTCQVFGVVVSGSGYGILFAPELPEAQ